MIPVLIGVTLLIFVLMNLIPGDPVKMILGSNASQADVDALTLKLGLNDPLPVRFLDYLRNIVTKLDFGDSYTSGKPVIEEIGARYPYTIRLALLGGAVSTVIGIICGIVAAAKQYSVFDTLATVIALIGVSMPVFWLALILILVFAIYLAILPVSGSYGPSYWILPVTTVGLTGAANIMRTTRSSMLETIRQDYIRTARAKGQSESVIIFRHAFKNAFIPILTVVGMQIGGILGGSVISETVFAIPGIGKYTIDAIKQRDTPAVMGSILILSFSVCMINLLVDLLYCYIDPRVGSAYGAGKRRKKKNPAERSGE